MYSCGWSEGMRNIDEKTFYFRKPLIFVVFVAFFLIGIFSFSDQLYGIFGKENYVTIHLLIEIFIIVATMSTALQIWTSSKYNLTNRVVYLSSLFMFIGIIEVLHTLSYKGMPFFIYDSDPYIATWFYITSRLILPLGLIAIFSTSEKQVNNDFRIVVWMLVSVLICFTIYIVYIPAKILPPLVDENGTTTLKNVLQYLAMAFQIIFIIILVKKHQLTKKKNIYYILASVCLIISDILYTTYLDVYDINNFLGHLFQLTAYYMLFQTIYYSSIELPYREVISAKQSLEKSEKEMKKMAYFDNLTGLPNERYLIKQLKIALFKNSDKKIIILLEIDRLAMIQSTLGSHFSDKLKQIVVKRIRQALPEEYTLSIIRDEHFAIFIEEKITEQQLLEFVQLLQVIMKQPFQIQHFSLNSRLNIGIAEYPKDAVNKHELLMFAQFAMYEARNTLENALFYEPAMSEKRSARISLENDLRKAIQNDELFLEYQPQLHLKSGKIQSMEALVRWQHPTKGWVSPGDFIPIAEESGLIIPIGQWVLKTACEQAKKWQEQNKSVKVAVNLSLGQLLQDDLVEYIRSILENTKLDPNYLQLEITESMTMNMQSVTSIIQQLQALGITIAVDDFGTGYSSLSYLKDFPLDCLKIDRTFVWNIDQSQDGDALVLMILSMAKHLKLKVVAEGIETEKQLSYLMQTACDKVQGFLISKPLKIDILEQRFDEIEVNAQQLLEKLQPHIN